jgi:hypothetical protein
MAKGRKRKTTKQPQFRRNRAGVRKKEVVTKTAKRKAQGKKTAISKALTSTKRSGPATKVVVIKALSDLQRTTAQKWAWVERQLKRA